jgi:hypothetical protein
LAPGGSPVDAGGRAVGTVVACAATSRASIVLSSGVAGTGAGAARGPYSDAGGLGGAGTAPEALAEAALFGTARAGLTLAVIFPAGPPLVASDGAGDVALNARRDGVAGATDAGATDFADAGAAVFVEAAALVEDAGGAGVAAVADGAGRTGTPAASFVSACGVGTICRLIRSPSNPVTITLMFSPGSSEGGSSAATRSPLMLSRSVKPFEDSTTAGTTSPGSSCVASVCASTASAVNS